MGDYPPIFDTWIFEESLESVSDQLSKAPAEMLRGVKDSFIDYTLSALDGNREAQGKAYTIYKILEADYEVKRAQMDALKPFAVEIKSELD